MSFGSKSGSKRNMGVKSQKRLGQKKGVIKKSGRVGAKYLRGDFSETAPPQGVVEKTLASIERLGSQVFALSPFSQYFDDWLMNLRRVVSDFEVFSGVTVDEAFVVEREQVFLDIEALLADHRIQESAVADVEKMLYELNHELRVIEGDYADKSRVLNNKRNIDTQQLTNQIRVLEEELHGQESLKFGVFQFGAKKAATEKLRQTQQSTTSAKKQLETTLQTYTTEHNKLYENYTAKKQELTTKSEALHKKIEQIEIDPSIETRKDTYTRLNNAINELIKRQPTTTDPSN
ncbi:MAG: hypothetical protein FWE56_05595 [Candidatus Bathyarchaeota archaeon]|nr:hypothetical protein [Candidatus Termiticorpusculum sp.]